jgi:putative FmdB family regulatory protein
MPVPLYEFRCPEGTTTESPFSMATVPDAIACPDCGAAARRRITGARLSRSGTPAYGLIESTERSAEAPEVVTSLPGPSASARSRKEPRHTGNPLHLKLPRP